MSRLLFLKQTKIKTDNRKIEASGLDHHFLIQIDVQEAISSDSNDRPNMPFYHLVEQKTLKNPQCLKRDGMDIRERPTAVRVLRCQ